MNREPHLVLIDDDPAWRETLADYLQTKGFRVESAGDGTTGLAVVVRGDAALVLVDSHMPDMNGLDFLRRLRRRSSVPVLMVSGEDGSSLLPRVLAAGGQGFLPKTTSPSVLLRTVRQLLGPAGPASTETGGARLRGRYLPVPRRRGWFWPMPLQDLN